MAKTTVAERARAYLEKHRDGIVRVAPGVYLMPSSSSPGAPPHEVRLDPRDCPCPYFSRHPDCKHRAAALILENEARGTEKIEISRATLARLLRQD